MDALIFAAGLGTRLGAITRSIPKALVPVGGVPMIERVAKRLIAAGADRLIINTHHFAESIVQAVGERGDFGVEVLYSHEPDGPLETGGGLKRASVHLRRDAPFFVHNVDILSDLPLRGLYDNHLTSDALATLAVMRRKTSRYLLFDDAGLIGRVDEGKDIRIEARKARGKVQALAFAGIHVISPAFLDMMTEEGVYSILYPYLRAVADGCLIGPYRVDEYAWVDIGRPEQLREAERILGSGRDR